MKGRSLRLGKRLLQAFLENQLVTHKPPGSGRAQKESTLGKPIDGSLGIRLDLRLAIRLLLLDPKIWGKGIQHPVQHRLTGK